MFNLNKVPGWFWAVLAALVVIMVFNRVSEGMENEDDMIDQDEEIDSDEEGEDEALDDAEDSDEEEDEEDGLDDEEIDSME